MDLASPIIADADIIIISFEFQKNMKRNQSVHMYKTNNKNLNPVSTWWAKSIQRIINTVPDASSDTKICTFQDGDKTIEFEGTKVRTKLYSIVDLIGKVE